MTPLQVKLASPWRRDGVWPATGGCGSLAEPARSMPRSLLASLHGIAPASATEGHRRGRGGRRAAGGGHRPRGRAEPARPADHPQRAHPRRGRAARQPACRHRRQLLHAAGQRPAACRPAGAWIRGDQGRRPPAGRGPGAGRIRRPDLVRAGIRRLHRADRAGLARLRGQGRRAARHLARPPAPGPAGPPGRSAGRDHRRLLRRRDLAPRRRLRPPDRRRRRPEHLEQPGHRAVPERRRRRPGRWRVQAAMGGPALHPGLGGLRGDGSGQRAGQGRGPAGQLGPGQRARPGQRVKPGQRASQGSGRGQRRIGAGAGLARAAGPPPAVGRSALCGRFQPQICAIYQQVAATGRATPQAISLLLHSSPASVAGRMRRPHAAHPGRERLALRARPGRRQLPGDPAATAPRWTWCGSPAATTAATRKPRGSSR